MSFVNSIIQRTYSVDQLRLAILILLSWGGITIASLAQPARGPFVWPGDPEEARRREEYFLRYLQNQSSAGKPETDPVREVLSKVKVTIEVITNLAYDIGVVHEFYLDVDQDHTNRLVLAKDPIKWRRAKSEPFKTHRDDNDPNYELYDGFVGFKFNVEREEVERLRELFQKFQRWCSIAKKEALALGVKKTLGTCKSGDADHPELKLVFVTPNLLNVTRVDDEVDCSSLSPQDALILEKLLSRENEIERKIREVIEAGDKKWKERQMAEEADIAEQKAREAAAGKKQAEDQKKADEVLK